MDRPLNVLYVLIGLNLGGVQQWVLDLGKRLDRKRFRPIVCAIENTGMYERLTRSSFELAVAYDATLEGWSRALACS